MRLINLALFLALLCVPALSFGERVVCGTSSGNHEEVEAETLITIGTFDSLDAAMEEDERLRQPANAAELGTLFNDALRDYFNANHFLNAKCDYCPIPIACDKIINPNYPADLQVVVQVITYGPEDHRICVKLTSSLAINMMCTSCEWPSGE